MPTAHYTTRRWRAGKRKPKPGKPKDILRRIFDMAYGFYVLRDESIVAFNRRFQPLFLRHLGCPPILTDAGVRRGDIVGAHRFYHDQQCEQTKVRRAKRGMAALCWPYKKPFPADSAEALL